MLYKNNNLILLNKNKNNIQCKFQTTGKINNICKEFFTKAPFLSLYLFNVKPKINEDIIVPFYVTDYQQSEYLYDDIKNFEIEVVFNGKTSIFLASSGDNEINIGKCKEVGENHFTIQAKDISNGLKSFKQVVNIFCIDGNYEIQENETYYMKVEDLTTYKINNENSEDESIRINNSLNINSFLREKRNEGYRKVVMLNSTGNDVYRIDPQGNRENAICVPSGLTLDGNGATIKQHVYYSPNGVGSSLIIKNEDNSFDSHLVNIKIEGDYKEHDLSPRYDEDGNRINEGFEAEGFNGIAWGGAFSSVKDVDMSYISSYAFGGIKNNFYSTSDLKNTFSACKIDIYTGKTLYSEEIITSDYISMTSMENGKADAHDFNFLTANIGGGYLGYTGESEIVVLYFYDSGKKYIGYEIGKQFSLIKYPIKTAYVRISLLLNDSNKISSGGGWGFRLFARDYMDNTAIEINNLYSHNTRSCAIAYGVYNNLYIHDSTFDSVAEEKDYPVTKLIIDFEDGYQYGHNLYFENNKNINYVAGGGFNMVVGYNAIFKNNINFPLNMWRVKGLVVYNDCELRFISEISFYTNMCRIQNIDFTKKVYLQGTSPNKIKRILKNCSFTSETQDDNTDENLYLYKCNINIPNAWGLGSNYNKCHIKLNTNITLQSQFIKNSTITSDNECNISVQTGCIATISYCILDTNINFYDAGGDLYLINCEIKNINLLNNKSSFLHLINCK